MSDEQKKEEAEVEGHMRLAASDEPTDEAEGEGDVEAHVRASNVRFDSPRAD